MIKTRPAIVLAGLALVVAACGGGGSGEGVASLSGQDTTTTTAGGDAAGDVTGDPSEADTEQALLDFAQCMRDHGIDMEDPTFTGGGGGGFTRIGPPPDGDGSGSASAPDREELQAAREACQQYLEGVTQGFGNVDRTQLQDQALEFAQCMRDHGIDMPDPDFSAGPRTQDGSGDGEAGGGPFGDIDPSDPAFQQAQEACGGVFGGLFGRPAGPGPGGGDASGS